MQFILAEPLNIAVVSHIGAQDYILCVTETQITDAAEGLELALRVREATGSTVRVELSFGGMLLMKTWMKRKCCTG